MRALIALGAVLVFCPAAWAEGKCDAGKPDIFTFVKWKVTAPANGRVEINMTFHNNLDQTLSQASFGGPIFDASGKQVQHISIEVQEDVAAKADHTETYVLADDHPDAFVAKVKDATPVLCAYTVIEKGTRKRTDYLSQ